ncbi:hypothetical protein ACGFIY_21500 [Micromonospora chersina]|uniref:hypothetical protein n=1 Tax=Micromonospora chersina TaxID=47854 RepID=UPI003724A3EE
MTDTHTAPPTTAATSTPRRTTTRPTVSVRPAAVGALNAATIAGATAVAAGAGPVLAAGAGILALGATAVGARKKGQAKRERTITITRGGGGGGSTRGGGLGRSGAASPGSRSAGSRSGGTGGGRSGGGGGKSRGAGLFGRSGGSGSGNGRSAGGKSTDSRSGRTRNGGGGNTGHRPAGSQPGSRSRSPLTADKVAAARRKLANRRQPGPRLSDAVRSALKPAATPYGTPSRKPTAREAFAAARRAVTGANPKKRGTVRRAVAGLTAGGLAAGKVAWDARRRRKRREAARARLNQRRIERLSNTSGKRVGTAVRRSATAVTRPAVRKPAPAPVARRANANSNPTVDNTRGLITMTHPLLAISEDFLAAAARNQPEGMLQVTAEAHLLPQVMENLVRAMKIRFDRAQEYPLHPSIKDMYGLVHQAQVAVQQAAEEIGPSIEKIHEHELNRLRNQRVGEEMFDVSRNRGAI